MIFGPQLAKDARADLRDAKCEPSRGEAAARCGSVWNRKFSIQNSRFKIKRVYRTRLCMCVISGCSLRRTRMFGYELRASARRRLRPAAASYRSRKFRIQNSRFKIKRAFWVRLGIYFRSGRSLRRTPATLWSCGPPLPPGCGPLGPIGPTLTRDKPAAERTGLHKRTFGTRKCSPPPGGGCGLLRLPAKPQIQNSKFKIQNHQSGCSLRSTQVRQRAAAR